MMSDNRSDDIVMDLDLNQEPLDPYPPVGSVLGIGSLLNDLETTHVRIEDRIRQLEAIAVRARQRQRWRQARNRPETSSISIEPMLNMGIVSGVQAGENSLGAQESTVERGKSCKRDSSHLVAKDSGMDSEVKRPDRGGGSFYDCNICLEMAREPILTCCGHLFCWACFYQLPYVDLSAKECPICRGEVSDMNITPIYGNGNDTCVSEPEPALKVPPRPRAHRRESIRPSSLIGAFSHIPVAEALRRIRNIGIGATWDHPRQQDIDGVSVSTLQFPSVLSETAASFSSISSALNNAERLVEDLEIYINDSLSRRRDAQLLSIDGGDPFTNNADVIQLENQTVHSTPEVNSTVLLPSSSRRRSGVSRVSDIDNGVSREPRRRRLR